MTSAAWIGLAVGVAIGVICGFWQARDMRRGTGWKRAGSSATRLVFLIVGLLAAYQFLGADKLWLVGGVAAAYTVVFVWKLKQLTPPKK